jgi:hypothetical protein
MKKITFFTFLLCLCLPAYAQVLNQSANWPNAAWTISGTYSTDPLAFEASPLTTANFAFDDDDAGISHEDNIIVTSPVTNLTPAFNANEITVKVMVQYGYRYLADDVLQFEYWNADTAAWVVWAAIPGNYNDTVIIDNFCTLPKTMFSTPELNIANFTPTQLSGFKYRISYNDSLTGADWNWGFCFNSPVLKSIACAAPSAGAASNATLTTVDLSWVSGGANNAEIVVQPVGTGVPATANDTGVNVVGTTYTAEGLTQSTFYEFYIRDECNLDTSFSEWAGPFYFNTLIVAPDNDECTGAISVDVNPDFSCAITTPGTLLGATETGYTTTCFGTPDDDVWFSFVATSTSHKIRVLNVSGATDMYHALFTGADCGSLTLVPGSCSDADESNPTGLNIGQTYYIQVYSYTDVPVTTTFEVCVGTPPPPPGNDECTAAYALTAGVAYTDFPTDATNYSATLSNQTAPTTCFGFVGGDVWYSVEVPSTGNITIETGDATNGDSGVDTVITAYTGDCNSLTQVGCDDDSALTGAYSLLALTGLTPGDLLYVRVYEYNNDNFGNFAISAYDGTLATNEFDNSAFSYYPNPVKNTLNLSYKNAISAVEVYNVVGQVVMSAQYNANQVQVDLATLANGAYLVKITANNEVKTIKVIKQ